MKGISPFVATILLIALVISIAIVLNVWYAEFIKKQTTIVGEKTEEKIACEDAGIKIFSNSIKCDFSGNATPINPDYLNFSVQNTGWIGLYNLIVQINLLGITHSFNTYDALTNLTFTKDYPLQPGKIATLVANITYDLPLKDPDWIVLITQCPGKDSGRIEFVDCTP